MHAGGKYNSPDKFSANDDCIGLYTLNRNQPFTYFFQQPIIIQDTTINECIASSTCTDRLSVSCMQSCITMWISTSPAYRTINMYTPFMFCETATTCWGISGTLNYNELAAIYWPVPKHHAYHDDDLADIDEQQN